ncbi:MAG: flagellar basal body-associated FliL family protein [Halopseudomonas sp.]|uniref:flagellar basal body-associated FliL family protein n=1 Tax=Halopseudomonas sp. TaxID=2901191 RepID=UPI0030037182
MHSRRLPLLFLAALLALPCSVGAAEEEAPAQATAYVEMKPSFVGTIGTGPRIQYLKADVALRTEDPAAVAKIEYHDPLIRNALVTLFARQTADDLASLDGKEALRARALEAVQAVLTEEEGAPLVEDLLFTNLIVQ